MKKQQPGDMYETLDDKKLARAGFRLAPGTRGMWERPGGQRLMRGEALTVAEREAAGPVVTDLDVQEGGD